MFDVVNMKEVIDEFSTIIPKSAATDIVDLAVNKAISKRQGNEIVTKVTVKQTCIDSLVQCDLCLNHKTMYITYANLKIIFKEVTYRK